VPRPVRLIAALLGVLALAGFAVAGAGGAPGTGAPPVGPRLAVAVWRGGSTTGAELLTIGPGGEAPRVILRTGDLTRGPELDHPNWSPDGTELAFFGSGDETTAVYVIGTDGSGPRLLASSEHPGGPDDATLPEPLFDPKTGDIVVAVVHTPNGEGLFGPEDRPTGSAGKIRTEFWTLSTDSSKARRLSSRTLSRKRPLLPYPSSIANDGTMAATALTRRGFAVVTVDPRGGAARFVVPTTTQPEGSLEPAISPDGQEIVYKVDKLKLSRRGEPEGLISTDVMIVPTSGGKPRLLARVKGGARWPSWDPSGSRIVFTALNAAGDIDYPGPEKGSALMEINPDGSCLTKVYAVKDGAVFGAAWQPGAERGAGPISC
jgi:dipeptidyl aminopeptidase/acylaminoacyl peptidase